MSSPCWGRAEQNWQVSFSSRVLNGSAANLQERHTDACLAEMMLSLVLAASWGEPAAVEADWVELCSVEREDVRVEGEAVRVEGEVVRDVPCMLDASLAFLSLSSSSSSVQRKGTHISSVSARHSKAE